MLARLGYGAAFVLVVLMLLVYAATVLPALPWWSWPVAVAGAFILRRWWQARRAGLIVPREPDPDGPKWNPMKGGGR